VLFVENKKQSTTLGSLPRPALVETIRFAVEPSQKRGDNPFEILFGDTGRVFRLDLVGSPKEQILSASAKNLASAVRTRILGIRLARSSRAMQDCKTRCSAEDPSKPENSSQMKQTSSKVITSTSTVED
jgi:hypothetical protein